MFRLCLLIKADLHKRWYILSVTTEFCVWCSSLYITCLRNRRVYLTIFFWILVHYRYITFIKVPWTSSCSIQFQRNSSFLIFIHNTIQCIFLAPYLTKLFLIIVATVFNRIDSDEYYRKCQKMNYRVSCLLIWRKCDSVRRNEHNLLNPDSKRNVGLQ